MKTTFRYKIDGVEVSKQEYMRRRKSKGVAHAVGAYSEARPLESLGASVHPSQVSEMNQLARAHGLTGLRYREDGMALFTSRKHRAKYLKLISTPDCPIVDRSGGYGDG